MQHCDPIPVTLQACDTVDEETVLGDPVFLGDLSLSHTCSRVVYGVDSVDDSRTVPYAIEYALTVFGTITDEVKELLQLDDNNTVGLPPLRDFVLRGPKAEDDMERHAFLLKAGDISVERGCEEDSRIYRIGADAHRPSLFLAEYGFVYDSDIRVDTGAALDHNRSRKYLVWPRTPLW